MNDRNLLHQLTVAALDMLDSWGRHASPDVIRAAGAAVEAGGRPAIVIATTDDMPEVLVAMRDPTDDTLHVLARIEPMPACIQ